MIKRISRRHAIKYGLASLGGAALVFREWRWLSLGLGSTAASAQTQRRVCVSVHDSDGRHLLDPVAVELQPVGGGSSIALNAEGTLPPVLYGGDVPEGEYVLTVGDVGTLSASPCTVSVLGEQAGCIGVYMFRQGTTCLVYRIGRSRIPFEYKRSILAVSVPGSFANPRMAQKIANKLAPYGLKPYPAVPGDPRSWIAARGYIWFFSLDLPAYAGEAAAARARLRAANAVRRVLRSEFGGREILRDRIRIGVPTQLEPGNVKVLDTRYVVRLKKTSDWRVASKLIRSRDANARVVRRLSFASDAYLVEFLNHDHPRHLRQVENWLRSGAFLYIEPDLIVELQQHACPLPLPNDPVASCQEGLKRQCVADAWDELETKFGVGQKYGDSAICLGLIEGPADPTHVDLEVARIKHCALFNWDSSLSCYKQLDTGKELTTEAGEDPGMVNHGTWVFGIGGAVAGNLQGVAGIAPAAAKVIAVPPSGIAITTYCEMVLWLAGLGVPAGSSAPLLGAPGNPPAADVISCSHGMGSMPTPAQVCDTFARVAREGRDGKGTVLVYSAGNENSLIENAQVFADDPHVVTVGATMIVDTPGGQVEKRWIEPPDNGSNYGHKLDLCAIGANVATLDPRAAESYVCGANSHQKISAPSGTSLAAPAVSATCVLMLTANPELRWCDMRELLRSSARRPLNASDVDFKESGSAWANERNLYFGSGGLDVFAAVQAASEFTATTGAQTCEVPCNYTAVCEGTNVGCQQG